MPQVLAHGSILARDVQLVVEIVEEGRDGPHQGSRSSQESPPPHL